jgi:hypothetical protein
MVKGMWCGHFAGLMATRGQEATAVEYFMAKSTLDMKNWMLHASL